MKITPIASGSSGNCYYVSDGYTDILLDCGIPVKKIQTALWDMGKRLSDICACLVTHEHGDHVKSAQKLADSAVSIFASEGTINAAGLSGHNIHMTKKAKDFADTHCRHPPYEAFEIGTFLVFPFDVEHDAKEPLGFVINSNKTGEKLLYVTDTMYLQYDVSGLTHLMIEANYDPETIRENTINEKINYSRMKRTVNSHMSIDTVLLTLERFDKELLKEVWLLHLSNDNAADNFRSRVQAVTGCEVYVA